MKYNIQKFAHILGKVGESVCDRCMTLHDASQMITSATDIKIFIETNKSTNLIVNKEKFEVYEDTSKELHPGLLTKSQKSEELGSSGNGRTNAFVIDENYMGNAMTGSQLEESKSAGTK